MDVFFRKELAMKRLVTGILGGSLVLGSLIGGASPAVAATAPPKICYFDNVAEIRTTQTDNWAPTGLNSINASIRSVGPTSSYPGATPFNSSSFSGDCPLDFQPTSDVAPTFFYYRDALIPWLEDGSTWGEDFYYFENGVKKYHSPLMRAVIGQQVTWNTLDPLYFYYQSRVTLEFQNTSYNATIGQVESRPVLSYNVPTMEFNRSVTYQPFANSSIRIWAGNAATENCDYDESICPGGYKFEDYLLLPKNPISVKSKALDTKISAKAGKKKGKTVTVTVNVDRQFTDANGNDVKRYAGDKVTIMRDGKVVGTAKVKKNGVAKVKIKDIKGDNVYTVTIPETNRNWDATTTFVK